jgi:hypothetical protein
MGDWVKQLCELPLSYWHGHDTISGLFAPAAAHPEDRLGFLVGFLQADGSRCDETPHTDDVAACVDFIYRQAAWVLHEQRVT